jgi:hypothetical protein
VAGFNVIFIVAVLRVFATPASQDLFEKELLPWPTWEWSLCALTPGLLIWLARSPEDWKELADERFFIKITLTFYLLWAVAFAVSQNISVLWVAVAASLGAFAGMWRLNRKERLAAA